jgi:hypothetical protein
MIFEICAYPAGLENYFSSLIDRSNFHDDHSKIMKIQRLIVDLRLIIDLSLFEAEVEKTAPKGGWN